MPADRPVRAVRLRPKARRDAADIGLFIAERNPAAADDFIERLDSIFRLLAENPQAGRARAELVAGLRSFPFDGYVVFYRLGEDAVEIVRILSGYQDIESEKFG